MLLRNKKNVLESVVYIYILLYNKEFVERNSLFIFTDLLRLFCLHWTSFKVFGHFPEFCLWREHAQKAARVAWHIHRWFVLIKKLREKKNKEWRVQEWKSGILNTHVFTATAKSPNWRRRREGDGGNVGNRMRSSTRPNPNRSSRSRLKFPNASSWRSCAGAGSLCCAGNLTYKQRACWGCQKTISRTCVTFGFLTSVKLRKVS